MPETLREALRVRTAKVHEELEQLPLLHALAQGTITRAQYGTYLIAQFRLHQDLETALRPWVPPVWIGSRLTKSRWLADDLAAMGITLAGASTEVPRINSWGDALGVLYVLEGSTLGVRAVRQRCPADHPARHVASRFLQGYGERTGQQWKEFVDVVNACPPEQWRAAIGKACKTFEAFRAAMDAAGREVGPSEGKAGSCSEVRGPA